MNYVSIAVWRPKRGEAVVAPPIGDRSDTIFSHLLFYVSQVTLQAQTL